MKAVFVLFDSLNRHLLAPYGGKRVPSPWAGRPSRTFPFRTSVGNSRFFRDQFQLEFYVRRLAKNGVRLTSITQDLGDDPMIMALFDEYQSKENAKHTLRAMRENARHGDRNGSRPPFAMKSLPPKCVVPERRRRLSQIPRRSKRCG